MANGRTINVQTPGAQTSAPAATAESPAQSLPADASQAPADLAQLPPDLQALVAKEVARALAQSMPRPQAAPGGAAVVHPPYAEVEAAKPDKPTMTDRGWYVPPTYGATPGVKQVI